MKRSIADNAEAAEKENEVGSARVRGLVAGLAFFAAGIALGAVWFSHTPSKVPARQESADLPGLSDATKAVLHSLGAPVEIRFYSLLDPASVADRGRAFSKRVDQLLTQYEKEAGGKIEVVRVNSFSGPAAKAAEADGIKAFNIDKGDACFLGIAVVRGEQRESLSSLAPEWEPALESDLSRAIAGVTVAAAPAPPAGKADMAALEAVRGVIPNIDSVSVEDGSRLLKIAALGQFEKTGQEMQAKVRQAEERFLQAQQNQSKAEQEAALKDLRQVQKEQAAKLTEVALASKAQLEALQQIKGAVH